MKSRSWFEWSRDMGTYLLAMSGIFVRRLTPLRVAVSLAIVVLTAWSLISGFAPSLSLSLSAFLVGYVLRYAFLFSSFTPNGIGTYLDMRFGRTTGFRVYEAATALQFFYRGLTFSWLVAATSWPVSDRWSWLIRGAGLLVAAIGTGVNLWATDIIGIRSYFYGDLYDGDHARADFKAVGPYRYLENPMYGVGQSAGYGAALMALSPVGLAATLLNQLTMYVFNALVERPHVQRVLRAKGALEPQLATG